MSKNQEKFFHFELNAVMFTIRGCFHLTTRRVFELLIKKGKRMKILNAVKRRNKVE